MVINHKLTEKKYKFFIIIIILACSPHEGFVMNCLALSPLGGGKRLSSTTKQSSWNPSRAQCSAFNLTLIIYLDFNILRTCSKLKIRVGIQ